MSAPVRLQLSRKKGFSLQALSMATNGLPAVRVDRSTVFGNPGVCMKPYGCPHCPEFEREAWEDDDGVVSPIQCCVDLYRYYIETGIKGETTRTGYLWLACEAMAGYPHRIKLVAALPKLAGKNLACWCGPADKCHADILLELANRDRHE